jgi:hypothetical protein
VQKYQQENMKNTIKATLIALAIAGVASSARATYSGDLLVGFTLQNGNDLVYDLGLAANLTDGETWSLNSLLAGANSPAFTLNSSSVQWGVIGSQNQSGTRVSWATHAGSPPPNVPNTTTWTSAIDANTTSMAGSIGVTTTSSPGANAAEASTLANSWNQQTIASANSGSYHKAYTNPNTTGYSTVDFYKNIANNTAAVQLGSFSFDNTGTLTFDAVSVPEPSMYGMFAAAGVLLVGLRNQFRRKQA